MRYITIPADQHVKAVIHQETKEPLVYSFSDFLEEHVWVDPAWRANEATWKAYKACRAALEGKAAGTICALESPDYEVFKPIASLQGKNIPPHVSAELMEHIGAVLTAPQEPPKSYEAPEADPEQDETKGEAA